MAGEKDQRPNLPSVLDRLVDDGQARAQSLKEMAESLRRAVRRDLEDLLNTRLRPYLLPPGLEELESSSFEFGIPDFSGANLSSRARQKKYLRAIEEIIRTHEPRFSSVRVIAAGDHKSAERALHFKIEAVLRTEPLPESVLYDSHVDVPTRSFRIQV